MPADLPSGTVTLLFTDIEGSTRMLQELGREAYVRALIEHRRLLREAFTSHGGIEVEMQGDSFFFAFPYAREAVAAAVAGQKALAEHAWEQQPIKVRIGLHTGEPMQADGLYAGLDVHHAARVMSAGHGGQILLSARTAELVESEMDLELVDLGRHRLKDLTGPQRLYQAGEGDFPPLKTLQRSNLPITASPLIGREAELEQLLGLLRDSARVVTVTGPGGTGKTRLALQAAADLHEEFRDGAVWLPLAALRDPALVLPSVTQALGGQEELTSRQTLLLLDNFEHLLDAASPLADVLTRAPGLKVLVTSRAALHVEGEHEFPLDPLPNEDAATLFAERARAAGRQLQADETVAVICERLDNLPLALELAAARTKLLAPEALLQRLDQRLPLLTGGRRDAPERQQTLRATIAWSYDLLDADSQELFAGLSVFAGSFSLGAAEEICDAPLDILAALVDNSLLKPIAADRFLLLETIREFAYDALSQTGQVSALRDRHAEWYSNYAVRVGQRTQGLADAEWLEEFHAEHDNLRAALETLIQSGRPREALQLVVALSRFWHVRGFNAEGLTWIERTLALSREAPSAERATALEAAESLARRLQDFARASQFSRERLAYAREAGDARGIAWSLASISADHQSRGEFATARELLREALASGRVSGDNQTLAFVLNELGLVAFAEEDLPEARVHFDEALSLAQEHGDDQAAGAITGNLAMVAFEQRRSREAIRLIEQSLELALRLGHAVAVAEAIDQTAMLATHEGDPRGGALLMGAAASVWQEAGTDLDITFRPLRERAAGTCRAAVGDAAFEQLWERGRSFSLSEAGEEARRVLAALLERHDRSVSLDSL